MKSVILIIIGLILGMGCINFFISAISSLLAFSLGGVLVNGLFCYVFGLLTKKCFNNA